jgi:hypothetical protein
MFCILAFEENESSNCSDWESLEEKEERSEELSSFSLQAGAPPTFSTYENKV